MPAASSWEGQATIELPREASTLRTDLTAIVVSVLLAACEPSSETPRPSDASPPHGPGRLDQIRLDQADAEPGNWFTNGRDRWGSYFSPLNAINEKTVDRLGFAWEYRLGTRGGSTMCFRETTRKRFVRT